MGLRSGQGAGHIYTNLGKPCQPGACFEHRGTVMLECLHLLDPVKGNRNATVHKVILNNRVLPSLWQQLGENLHV